MKNSLRVNREYYDSHQPGRYDYWRFMAAPRLRVARIRHSVSRIAPASIADLGCGEGLLLRHLQKLDPARELVGIDLSPVQVERNARADGGIRWIAADIGADDLQSDLVSRFEMVISSEVIEHVDDDEAFLTAARRIAAPDGWLMLTTQSGPIRATERTVGHVRHYSRDSMESLLTRTGWTSVAIWNEGFPFHDLSKWAANIRPEMAMRRFGERSFGPFEHLTSLALRAAFLLNSRSRGAQLFALARNQSLRSYAAC